MEQTEVYAHTKKLAGNWYVYNFKDGSHIVYKWKIMKLIYKIIDWFHKDEPDDIVTYYSPEMEAELEQYIINEINKTKNN